MADSLLTRGDGQTNQALDLLRGETREGKLKSRLQILPGIELHAAKALKISGTWRSPPGHLLELDIQTKDAPDGWIGLHLALPVSDLAGAGVAGFAARVTSPQIAPLRVCLRSGIGDGFADCFFDKHVLAHPEESTHVDALAVHQRSNLPLQAPWRELVFFLPEQGGRFALIDLRVFVV